MARVKLDTSVAAALKYDADFIATLKLGLTPALSRGLSVTTSHQFNTSGATAVTVSTLRNGYSYSMNNLTRRLAVAVVLLHILIALIHTVIVVSYGWNTSELRSLSHMVFLAINSPPSDADSVSGEKNAKQYNHTLKVRELSDSKLGLVIDSEKSDEVLLQNISEYLRHVSAGYNILEARHTRAIFNDQEGRAYT
ncbi:hypothetical protein BP5796_04265 [Coleophoma crateriformis]|uniref:Uncharacterized protein n=1 Tax=Coleophoma crateriformis TaxID=565419 RepID=A0A3D8SHZ4_9HELO|nr:hypothetical protein BP5796_04265 [Coleophoma crateriformis]